MTDFDLGVLRADLQAVVDRHGLRSMVVMVDVSDVISGVHSAADKTMWLNSTPAASGQSLIGSALNAIDCCSHVASLAVSKLNEGTRSMLHRSNAQLLELVNAYDAIFEKPRPMEEEGWIQ